jgi:phosphotransacetylase
VFGKTPRIAFLSFSTHGSSSHPTALKMAAAAAQAKELVIRAGGHDALDHPMEIDGELQADTALVSSIARIKVPDNLVAGSANVLIFPDLNSGNIAVKLLQHLGGARVYGHIVNGLSRPAARISRGTLSEDIAAVAAIVGLQAIEYRKLYPMGDNEGH